MKLFKLWVHQHTFSEDELIVNTKEFPDCHVGDVLEIYHPDEQSRSKRLLLQIKSIRSDFQQKDTISIEQSIANCFQLRTYSDVIVCKVDHKSVEVDLVEVIIKDQYISRNDMWRLSKALVGKCAYISKKILFCGLRGQIHELWKQGKQMTCGVISKETRVVYRSLSAQIFLFIQMSCEMWEFDLNGDLYFEKVINGFLYELFTQWKNKKANHEVTIVLFSRTFYTAQNEDDFSPPKRKSILQDPYGRYYEDFYQVLVRGERKDDWLPILVTLKYHINQYQKYIGCQDQHDSPTGKISSAHEGNFLEAINVSMNIFEKHYLDCNFDCTGQSILLVTPGTGVFEVDRSLNSITKQRMIDSGVAVDLVCMAEQPLHSVPLLKFFNKGGENDVNLGDDYNIPHWMNHSFYASPKSHDKHHVFLPRIKLPDVVFNWFGLNPENNQFTKGLHKNFQPKNVKEQETNQIPDFINYDEFDAKVFCNKAVKRTKGKFGKHRSAPSFPAVSSESDFERLTGPSHDDFSVTSPSANSPSERHHGICIPTPSKRNQSSRGFLSSSLDQAVSDYHLSGKLLINDESEESKDEFFMENLNPVVGSADAPRKLTGFLFKHSHDARRTLFNPFKPLNIPCRWTCNRHRWAHSFPKGQDGIIIHRQFLKHSKSKSNEATRIFKIGEEALSNPSQDDSVQNSNTKAMKTEGFDFEQGIQKESLLQVRKRGHNKTKYHHNMDAVEKDWTAEVETSVDWKSLILPACLPLTSEYCPDTKTLDVDYLEFHYELCIGDDDDSSSSEYMISQANSMSNPARFDEVNRHPVSVNTMITELVAQRLSKGFQILTDPPHPERPSFPAYISQDEDYESEEYFLSLGRNIHRLSVIPKQSQINVTRYQPRHVRGLEPFHYWHQLRIGHSLTYQMQETEFQHDELDRYNWNYLDQHISGIQDFAEMVESLRYWKSRFLLLPLPNRKKPAAKEDGSDEENIDGILKYLEILNGIKGGKGPRRPKSPLPGKTNILKQSKSQEGKKDNDKNVQRTGDNKTDSKDDFQQTKIGVTNVDEKNAETSSLYSSDSQSNLSLDQLSDASNTNDDGLTVNSPIEKIGEAMLDTVNGFPFMPSSKGLPPFSFLSIECVWWMMQFVKGLTEPTECLTLTQRMVDAKVIQHASGNPRQNFACGFVIFFITSKDNWSTSKESTVSKPEGNSYAAMLLEESQLKFQENWFEVLFDFPSTAPVFLSSDAEILHYYDNSVKGPFTKRTRARSTTQMPHHQGTPSGPAYKTVYINCDLQRKSDRNEYAVIRYHGNYSNTHAFELEVHWIGTTGSIVHDLVQGWARKASSCGCHLVPVPVSPFPDRIGGNMDPLRLPVFTPVDINVIQEFILKDCDPCTHRLRTFLFLEAILHKFQFLKDSPSSSSHSNSSPMTTPVQRRSNDYIHASGSVIVQIVDHDKTAERTSQHAGFYWTRNFTLTKKWRSSATGDAEFAIKLIREFEEFCSNTDDSLKIFCENIINDINRIHLQIKLEF